MASKRGKKSERLSKTPEISQVEERPAEKEFIPGKGFYEKDWKQMLENEEDLAFICDLVEKVFENSCVGITFKATEDESYSHSVCWAKEMMLDTIQCFFIRHDVGEHSSSKTLLWEEVEPSPPVVDSWARGVVPMVEKSESKERIKEDILHEENETNEYEGESLETNPSDEDESTLQSIPLRSSDVEHKTTRHHLKKTSTNLKMRILSPPTEEGGLIQNESASIGSHTPLSSTAFISIPPLITCCTNDVPKHKMANKRSEVMTDKYGRVIETIKLDSRKFPSPSIRPIISMQETNSVQRHVKNAKTCVNIKSGVRKQGPSHRPALNLFSEESIQKHSKNVEGERIGGINRIEGHRVQKGTTLPPLLDIIDPLPGVTVYENGRKVTGHPSPRNQLRSPRAHLQPITSKGRRTTINSSESRRKRQDDPLKFLVSSPLEHDTKTYSPLNVR